MRDIFIATPMYGGACTGTYAYSLWRTPLVLAQAGINASFNVLGGESLITRARNLLVKCFLDTDASHMLFIDADIGYKAEDIVWMVEQGVEIIGGIYPIKLINWARVHKRARDGAPAEELATDASERAVNWAPGLPESKNGVVEVDYIGTGFLLIQRQVFEKLGEGVPTYVNDIPAVGDAGAEPRRVPIKEFFATSIDPTSRRLLSEDFHFCRLARDKGIRVHAALRVNLTHTGTYVYQ